MGLPRPAGFSADALVGNSRMLRIFRRGDHDITMTTEAGTSEVVMLFSA